MNSTQREFLDRATEKAINVNHSFAKTVGEATIESRWGDLADKKKPTAVRHEAARASAG